MKCPDCGSEDINVLPITKERSCNECGRLIDVKHIQTENMRIYKKSNKKSNKKKVFKIDGYIENNGNDYTADEIAGMFIKWVESKGMLTFNIIREFEEI